MQYLPHVQQPSRALVVPLIAAALGAGVATATFAVVNIEDQPSIALPTPAVQSAPPSDAVAGQRNDAGPAEGAAQQSISQRIDAQVAAATAARVSATPRYDGGPNEGSSVIAVAKTAEQSAAPSARYDGGPNEGSNVSALAQPAGQSAAPEAFSGARP